MAQLRWTDIQAARLKRPRFDDQGRVFRQETLVQVRSYPARPGGASQGQVCRCPGRWASAHDQNSLDQKSSGNL